MRDISYKYFSTNIFVSVYGGCSLFCFGFSHTENYFFPLLFFIFYFESVIKAFPIPKN